jgi:two-component system invasion response regulator UvrY
MHLAHVILIDDDQFVRSTLSTALTAYGINTVGTFNSAKGAVELVKEGSVEVCVIDLDLGPGPSGIDIAHSLRKIKPEIGLIILTSYSDPRISQPNGLPLPKGCRFVTKNDLSDFSFLVREILYVRRNPLARTSVFKKDLINLTNAQLEILKSVAAGLSSQEIADQRGVSIKTIEAAIATLSKTLDIDSHAGLNKRVQLARSYFRLSGKNPPGE